jgi:hypothetical protein
MTAPQIASPTAPTAGGDAAVAEAHRELLANRNLQFEFERFDPPEPPAWLEPFLRVLGNAAPVLEWVFWGGVAIVVALILYVLVTEIIRRMPRRVRDEGELPKPEYRPAVARAKALLEEADRLAAEGHYSEAARVLLHRSIEDLERVFTLAIGPGLTSREIAQLEPLSNQGRDVFSGIARAVERSLFGGRALGAGDFAQCREAYASFALQGSRR